MKKRLLIMGLTALNLIALASCGPTSSPTKNLLEEDKSSLKEASYSSSTEVIFSEYFEGSSSNRALELYNFTDNDVDLGAYSIYIYTTADLVPTYAYKLKGTLKAKSTYVIVGHEADEALIEKADALSTFTFQGKQSIALVKEGKIVDVLGNIGFRTDWGKDCTFVRKVDHLLPETLKDNKLLFDTYSWIKYNKEYSKLLGNVENTVTISGLKFFDDNICTKENNLGIKIQTDSLSTGYIKRSFAQYARWLLKCYKRKYYGSIFGQFCDYVLPARSGRTDDGSSDEGLWKSVFFAYEGRGSRELHQRSKKENRKDTQGTGEGDLFYIRWNGVEQPRDPWKYGGK